MWGCWRSGCRCRCNTIGRRCCYRCWRRCSRRPSLYLWPAGRRWDWRARRSEASLWAARSRECITSEWRRCACRRCALFRRDCALSVVLAIVISFVALWLAFQFREEARRGGWRKVFSAIVMGAAIPVMHYTGMAAASFMPAATAGDLSHALSISSLGMAGIIRRHSSSVSA